MLTKSIEILAKDLGLKNIAFGGTKDERAFGIYRDYLLAISEKDDKKTAFFGCPFDTDEDSVFAFEFSQALTETANEIAECICTVEEDGITLSSSCDLTDFREIIEATIDMLVANEIPCSNKCIKCGASFAHKKIMVMNKDGVLSLVCESCALNESLNNNKKKAAAKATKSQSIKGVLGAFIGAVIGVCVLFGVALGLGKLLSFGTAFTYGFSLLCFVSAAITFLFSKLIGGKKCLASTISVCAFSLLLNAVARILISAYQVLTQYGYSLSVALRTPASFIRLPFSTPVDGLNIYQSLIIDALFGLVALAIFAFGLFNSEKKSGFSIEPFVK